MAVMSYLEAAEQVHRFVRELADGRTLGEVGAEAVSHTETVALAAAAGRVLAEGIQADRDQPPFPRSKIGRAHV